MKYKTIPGVILTSVCGHSYLVTPNETIGINETAACCWKRLATGATPEELAALVTEEFDTAENEKVMEDIERLISVLLSSKLAEKCVP